MLILVSITLSLCAAGREPVGKPPRPARGLVLRDSAFAGRAHFSGETYLLELETNASRIVRIDEAGGVVSSLTLAKTPIAMEKFGLARSAEGVFWALADRGRLLIGFDSTLGTVADSRPLPSPAQQVWDVGGTVMVAALPLSGGEPVIQEMKNGQLHFCGPLRTRRPRDFFEAPILSLLACGASDTAEVPCWWMAAGTTLFLTSSTCEIRQSPAPSLARIRPDAARRTDPMERFPYPIRDVFVITREQFWLLPNQEGEQPPFENGASPARHLLLVVNGIVRKNLALARKARLILSGDAVRVCVLYSDGTIERILVP